MESVTATSGGANAFLSMDLELGLYNHPDNGEDGYRHLHIRIYGPCNYVAVLVKEDWTLIHESYMEYHEGNTGWMLASYHDSCWRDAVQDILRTYEDRLSVVHTFHHWYVKKVLTEAERKEIHDLLRVYPEDRTRHWDRTKVVGPFQFPK